MYTLRYYQSDCIYAIFDYFHKGGIGNPVCALPTGTGKSIIIAQFIKDVLSYWPNQRVMMLTHVKELIEQNAEKLLALWPTAPMGIFSAGLNRKESAMPLIFGGIQSVAKTIKKESNVFGYRDLLLIDEAHLLSPKEDTMYQYVINELLQTNPNLKVIGFTEHLS